MAESRVLISEKKVKYAGLIPVKGIYKLVNDFLDDNGYGPYEARNEEEVYEDGKQIEKDGSIFNLGQVAKK